MEQPNASLPYFNTYGVKTGDLITPNLGVSRTLTESDGYIRETVSRTKLQMADPVTVNTAGGTIVVDKIPVVPGSLKITLTYDATTVVITDDGAGSLLAGPGILSAGTVNYGLSDNTPVISFESASAAAATSGTVVVVEYIQDLPKELNEKLKGELEYYNAKTSPIIVPLILAA